MFEVAMSFETGRAIDRLTKILNLPETGQDFDFEAADPDRVEEFCDAYESAELTAEEKFALMTLIISSYDYRLTCKGEDRSGERIQRLLQQDYAMHFHTVESWANLDIDEPEEEDFACEYPISPLMRRIWRDCTPPLLVAATLDDSPLDDDEIRTSDAPTLNSALMRASELGHVKQVEQLLQHGVDPNARDYYQRTALHYSAGSGHGEVVSLFVNHGADLNVVDEFGSTPLNTATDGLVTNKSDAAFQQLLSLGADPLIADINGYTPLLNAVQMGMREIVRQLLPISDVTARNVSGEDALAIARRCSSVEMMKTLSGS